MGENNGHNFRIFLASFLTIFANGVAFAVRGAILGDWAQQFGFTKAELGNITGGGLWGFGLIILISSLFMDKVGYKAVLLVAFLLHLVSGVVTLSASHVFETWGRDATYNCLNWGLILFAVGNGLCVSRYDASIFTHTTATLSYQSTPVLVEVALLHKGGLTGGPPSAHGDAVGRGVREYVEQFAAQIRDAR